MFNGTTWVDLCSCIINIWDYNRTIQSLNPNKCTVKVWTGEKWCEIKCPEDLICGGELNFEGTDGIFYIPFTLPVGIYGVTFTVSPFGNPDSFSIVDSTKTNKLASIGLAGLAGTLGWSTSPGGNPQLTKPSFTYINKEWVAGPSEIITYYGEGVGDSPGQHPMSNTDANTEYNPGQSGIPSGTPIPSNNSSNCGGADTCYDLTYTRANANSEETILLKIAGGGHSGSGWAVFNAGCIECASLIDIYFQEIFENNSSQEERLLALSESLENGLELSPKTKDICCPSCEEDNIYYFGTESDRLNIVAELGNEGCCLDSYVFPPC